ncbi:MAG: sulfotransferase [bacterium]
MTSEFPASNQVRSYERVRNHCEQLGAEFKVFFASVRDLPTIDPAERAWLGHGFPSRYMAMLAQADVEHFRSVTPERLTATMDALVAHLGRSAVDLLAMPSIAMAFSHARWVKAWAPDLILSFYAHEGSLAAFVAASLLDLPRVFFLNDLPHGEEGVLNKLLPLHASQAQVIVVPRQGVADALVARFGEATREKIVSVHETPAFDAQLVQRIESVLATRPPSAKRADLGPSMSFRTSRTQIPGTLAVPDVRNSRRRTMGTRATHAMRELMLALRGGRAQPFVVVGAERTGSNLLIDMLDSHGGIASAGELFNPRMIREGRLDTQLPQGVNAEEIIELRLRDPAACHLRILEIARSRRANAAGFKLLYFHAIVANALVDHLLSLPQLRVIHLVRRDRLARWVSQLRAEQSDSWWVGLRTSGPVPNAGAIELDPTQTFWDFEWEELLEDRMGATFAGCDSVEFSYEDMSEDLAGRSARVLDFLGVSRRPLRTKSVKTGEHDPRKLVANWDTVRDAFVGTRWQFVFDDV